MYVHEHSGCRIRRTFARVVVVMEVMFVKVMES